MIDVGMILGRLLSLVFTPLMLLFPIVFVLLTRTRVTEEARRAEARARGMALVIATLVALAAWIGLLLISIKLTTPVLSIAARMCWLLFFPLWFGLAVPALRSKNPAWVLAPADPGVSPVRTASIVNRERRNPIRTGHWVASATASAILLGVIASRGVIGTFDDAAERTRWLITLAVYGVALITVYAIQPMALRLALREPEPLDARGSEDLQRLYDEFRDTKIRGMFWMLGTALPVLLGASMSLTVWTKMTHGAGVIGAIVGTGLGIWGSWFGISMSIRRARISEEKTRLDAGTA
ncbi:MAG: hypothetical protein KF787_07240 [Phycisphaeraceae bacterium]|nr:hypothetical protein [Phycisphaerae bacterium]MBX3392428.1 hypothetical protein [Phycisphaeraceae bacterium]